MECITERDFILPGSTRELEGHIWFGFWKTEFWPYRELDQNDTVYWFEGPTRQIVWESTVNQIERVPYNRKQDVLNRLSDQWGASILHESSFEAPFSEPYLRDAPEQGYCLAFKVRAIRHLAVPKPASVQLPPEGWLKLTTELEKRWGLAHSGSLHDARVRQP